MGKTSIYFDCDDSLKAAVKRYLRHEGNKLDRDVTIIEFMTWLINHHLQNEGLQEAFRKELQLGNPDSNA